MKHRLFLSAMTVIALVMGSTSVEGQTPLNKFLPFKKIDADPAKAYWLTEDNGPWLIFATSFAGPGAERQAHDLVLEIRKSLKVPAYVYKRGYDFSKPVVGLGVDQYGNAKKMRHRNASKFEEIAVLVGNYNTFDDVDAQKMLETLRYLHPKCLELDGESAKTSTQRFAAIRYLQKVVSTDREKQSMGQLRRAFIARNPMVPKEYFVSSGLDPLVLRMNKSVKYSLLDNPGRFTVKVATFGGKSYFVGEEQWDRKRQGSKGGDLEIAAEKAHQLTLALREKGVEAWEFHDRHESIVTVGGFESVGTPRSDGKTEIHPGVHQIMQAYGAERKQIPGLPSTGLAPKMLAGVQFDVQPLPVMVPRASVGDVYATEPGYR